MRIGFTYPHSAHRCSPLDALIVSGVKGLKAGADLAEAADGEEVGAEARGRRVWRRFFGCGFSGPFGTSTIIRMDWKLAGTAGLGGKIRVER